MVRVEFGCDDVCDPDTLAEGNVNGIPVESGDVITTDDDDSDHRGTFVPLTPLPEDDGDSDGGFLALTVTCTDASGNFSMAEDRIKERDDGFRRFGCGLGFELVFLLPPLMWLRGRPRRATA